MQSANNRSVRRGLDSISVSIVVYRPDQVLLSRTVETLRGALAKIGSLPGTRATLYLIDNGTGADSIAPLATGAADVTDIVMIAGHGNVGYGRGHNLALARTTSRYHLVLNPDIELDGDALAEALDFLDLHPGVGLVSPFIRGDDGHQQFLCRRFPSVFDLFARGFLPGSVRRLFARRLARYEMRDVIDSDHVVMDPPIVSGCFMLFRTDVLKQLGGFDPRYFLYFEDYDLSLRTHEITRVAYVPTVRVLHHGGGAARKGLTHIRLFVVSAYKFFSQHGWKWL